MSPVNCSVEMAFPRDSFLSLFRLLAVEGFGREPVAQAIPSEACCHFPNRHLAPVQAL